MIQMQTDEELDDSIYRDNRRLRKLLEAVALDLARSASEHQELRPTLLPRSQRVMTHLHKGPFD